MNAFQAGCRRAFLYASIQLMDRPRQEGSMPLGRTLRRWVRRINVEHVKAVGILFAAGGLALAYFEYQHKGQEGRLQRALSLIEKANTEPTSTPYRALPTTDAEELAAK